MNEPRWIVLVLVLMLALAHSSATVARAQDADPSENIARAESHATAAFEAYTRGEYQAAVELYLEALSAAHSANTLYNLARIYDVKLNDRAHAIEYYERYTRDTGADPALLRTANERLARLRELETLASGPPVSPAQPVVTEPAEPSPPAQVASSSPAPREPGAINGWQLTGLVTGVVGLTGVGLGVGYGLAAKSDSDTAKEDCEGNLCSSQRALDAADDASDKATISTVAFIAGGALFAVGASLLLFGGDGERERDTPRSPVATLYVQPDAVGTSVVGRW